MWGGVWGGVGGVGWNLSKTLGHMYSREFPITSLISHPVNLFMSWSDQEWH